MKKITKNQKLIILIGTAILIILVYVLVSFTSKQDYTSTSLSGSGDAGLVSASYGGEANRIQGLE